MLKNIRKDEFLTKIIGYKCFNISNIDIHTKFEKKSFYSYIIPYSSKNLNNSQKLGFKYVSSRIIFKYDKNISTDFDKIKNYEILYNSRDLAIKDFNNIIDVLSKTSRFYNDNKIKKYAKKIYREWIYNSLFKKYADKLIIVRLKKKIIAFASLKIFKMDCIIDLIGIDGKYQNQGLGSYLLRSIVKKFNDYNIYVGTEAENINAVSFYLKNNFKIYRYKLIFHKHT
jgi:ribosomal protein S18 acetylase RimI-like enzyme